MRKATKWEARMLRMAKLIATFSKDPSTKVGAVIYNPERKTIITTGYNGFPRNTFDTPELYNDRSRKYPRVVHAEMNAIVEAAAQGVSTLESTLAVTHHPCGDTCSGVIIQAGIKHIVYEYTDDDMVRHNSEEATQLFKEANIAVDAVWIGEE